MELQWRQLNALIKKDLLLLFARRSAKGTVLRAFIIPIFLAVYLTILFRLFWPKAAYGIGSTANPVRSLVDAMNAAGSGRTTLVLMNNSTESGGDIDRLINAIAGAPRAAGKKVLITSSEDDLHSTCRSALQGNTKCFGAAVFQSSPSSAGGSWNYTLRADAALGKTVDIGSKTNDVDIYVIPLQHAIDSAIANLNVSGTSVELPARVQDYLFTSQTQEQRKEQETIQLLKTNINFVAVVWYLTLIGLTYQLVGLMAKERETEMSALIESMMPNLRRWEPQAIRLIARHIAFDIVYGPSWILVGLIAKGGLFQKSNTAIPVIGFVLAGLALTSFSLLGASFFKRAQLSSITVLLVAVVLAVATQIRIKSLSTVPVAILSLIFSPVAFVHFFILCSRWEFEKLPIDMTTAPPNTIWHVPGLSFWVFFIVQIVVYPLLAALVERKIHGTTASRKGREVAQRAGSDEPPIIIFGFTKIYSQPEFLQRIMRLFRRKPTSVLAVDDLSLSVLKGQITVLVGANGCGKSTTLNAIAGLTGMTSGRISLDGTGGIGLCPQKNVLWNSLTVKQHANIFNRLKAGSKEHVGQDVDQLTKSCGLADKVNSPSRSLSGGQKRKLQLVMMLTGGSRVCCVDEVSGGLDPLSRRRIWDILLAERGVRTVILTTHFLDEAEFLADTMVVMSKGQLKAQGSTSELKSKLGNGYRVQVLTPSHHGAPGGAAISHEKFDQSETTSDPSSALALIKALEKDGITNYQVAGPTIEEVFMKLAADLDAAYDDSSERLQTPSSKAESEDTPETSTHKADTSTITVNTATSDDGLVHQVGAFQQALILFQKRWTVFKRNPWPILLALLLPVIASGLESMLLSNTHNTGCSLSEQVGTSSAQTLSAKTNPLLVVGPKNAISADKLQLFSSGSLAGTVSGKSNTSLLGSVHYVNSLPELFSYTNQHHTNVTPGGLYLGDSSSPPTFNARSNVGTMGIFAAVLVQNILNVLLTNTPITTQYAFFDFPWPADTTDTLQFTFYFGLIMASYPALFALYACQERVRGVRAMEYSNGVRPISLWAAYLLFDWMVVLLVSAAIAIIFATATGPAWYHVGYLFVIMVLYGLASILLSYAISLLAKSHFAAFALAAGGQALMLILYLTAFMFIQARADPDQVAPQTMVAHYTIGLISPVSQLIRALLLSLNLFSILCRGSPPVKSSNPGAFDIFGGPVTYLICQSFFLFGIIVWADHRFSLGKLKRKPKPLDRDVERSRPVEREVAEEEARASNSHDGLRVVHIDKYYKSSAYGTVHAVDDLTFGVKRGEVFALVGPNGAGKSSTIGMLRGQIQPSGSRGELFIQDISIAKDRYLARSRLGVCPQFDAMDMMTVREHLTFYAHVRGVANVAATVSHMIKNVGLQPFANRLGDKLSGGNKRKLSLAIALIGNPSVVLLDEPSSGMDPLAKRNMWKTLEKFRPGRSILLTTHSMEESDRLATRVGIIANRLLDIGTTAHLRNKHGHGFHIQLVLRSAPNTSAEEMSMLRTWVEKTVTGAQLEGLPYHGQLRFSVPSNQRIVEAADEEEKIAPVSGDAGSTGEELRTVGSLFVLLEENKEKLGVEFYSVSPSTFDEVFLKVIDKHQVGEEELPAKKSWLARVRAALRSKP